MGRYGDDNGQGIDLSILKVGAIKIDLEGVLNRHDKGLVVLSYEVMSHEVAEVGGKDQGTLARVHKAKVIGAVPLPEGFDRQALWDAIQLDVDAKKGKQQFDWGGEETPNPLDTVAGDGSAKVRRSRKAKPEPEADGDDDGAD